MHTKWVWTICEHCERLPASPDPGWTPSETHRPLAAASSHFHALSNFLAVSGECTFEDIVLVVSAAKVHPRLFSATRAARNPR